MQTPPVKLDCREVVVAVRIVLPSLSRPLPWPCPALSLLYFFDMGSSLPFLLSLSPMPGAILERNGPSTEELHAFFAPPLSFPLSLSLCVCTCVFLKEHVLPCQVSCPLQRCCVVSCSQSLRTVLAVS